MQLKNLDTGVTLSLPGDLLWSDEHTWLPAVASASYLVTNASLIQSATRQAGQPVTLAGALDMAWVTRAAVEQSRVWAAIPVGGSTGRFELTFADGRVFTVTFHHAGTAIEAEPVLGVPTQSGNGFYYLTLRFPKIA